MAIGIGIKEENSDVKEESILWHSHGRSKIFWQDIDLNFVFMSWI